MPNLPASAAMAGLLSIAGAACAQPSPPTEVSPLVVSPTLTPTPIDQVGSSVTLISADDLAALQRRTLPDALAAAPGLNVVQTGGPGGLTSVFIRGANANHTEIVIDGIDVNDPSQNGAFDLGQALTAGGASIEVLRGPQSSLYGADALGGVIRIETPEGRGRAKASFSLEGGSFDTFNQTAGVSGSAGDFHFDVDLAHFRSGDTPVTPAGVLAPGESAIGDRYDNVTLAAKLSFDLTRNLSTGVTLRYVDATHRSTGENFDVPPDFIPQPDSVQTSQWEKQVFGRVWAKASLFDGRFENTLSVAYANFRTVIQSPDDGFGLPAPVVDKGDRLKIDWLGDVALDARNKLLVGVDGVTDRLVDSPVSAIETRIGGFAELQAHPAPRLSIAASARYDSDDRYGSHATWRLAPVYEVPGLSTIIRGSVGTGFKSPTLTELFVSYPAFGFFANPNLKPETSFGYDLGFEQPIWGGRARLGATWFRNDIRDLIESNATFTSYANIGRAETWGVESFATLRLGDRLILRGDSTWLTARDAVARTDLLRRPRNKASVTARWTPAPRLRLSASLVYVGAWRDYDRSGSFQVTASPFASADLAGEYDLGRGVTAFARVANLLDRHYEDPVGFDKPGLGVFGGVRVSFRP